VERGRPDGRIRIKIRLRRDQRLQAVGWRGFEGAKVNRWEGGE